MPKIVHYRNKCIGCNICFELQPGTWRMSNKDGKATLINSSQKKEVFISLINQSLFDKSQEVARACPVKIIKII
jgi:ferredoxin